MKAMRMGWIAGLGIALAACSHAPTTDIDAARHAMDEARQAQAAEYAPQSWTAAQDADAKLQAELDAQEQRWAPLRSYTVAKQLADAAKTTAERSKDDATAGKEQAKNEASTLMAQARDEASRAHTAVGTAPHGKGTEADLASLKTDATSIDDTLNDMQKRFDAGDFLGAKTKAQAAIDAAKKIEAEIDQAKSSRHAA